MIILSRNERNNKSLTSCKLNYPQAKICGRSNIVKDDIRWVFFFSEMRLSDFFSAEDLYWYFQGYDRAVHGRQEQCDNAAREQRQVHAVIPPWVLHSHHAPEMSANYQHSYQIPRVTLSSGWVFKKWLFNLSVITDTHLQDMAEGIIMFNMLYQIDG